MRLVTYQTDEGHWRPGLVIDAGIVDVRAALSNPTIDVLGVILNYAEVEPILRECAKRIPDYELSKVKLGAPIPRPGKILALGLNYQDHAVEANMALPNVQTWFSKMPTSVNGPHDIVHLPRVSSKLDYEAELAFVIGKKVRHATRAQAKEAIFGYCCANDVSVRDWQLRTSQFVVGKSFDTHCPFGPWIVTADEIRNPQALSIRCTVNGEVRQDSNTREMVFDVYAMVEHLSQAMTLEPGDLVLSGTPAGVGAVRTPPVFLKAGDVVGVEIESIGAISNQIVAEPV